MTYWNFPRGPATVRLLLDAGEARQIEASALLRGSGLSLAQLDNPEATVSAAQELAVVARLLKHVPEDDLGLQVGLSYRLSAYGILGYGLMSSATGEEALRLAIRFLPLTYAFTSIAHRRVGARHALVFEPPGELAPELRRFVVERAMGAAARLLRDVLGTGFGLADFRLRFPAPAAAARRGALERVLGTPVRHGASENSLAFAHEALVQPLAQANRVTAVMCERMCADLLARRRVRLDTAAFVSEYLSLLPAGQAPALADAARLLNLSERSLKRRLQQEGATFRGLSKAVRQAKAMRLIAEGQLTMGEIAAELGFSDAASFSQAFKRWSGVSPSRHAEKGRF